MIDPVNNLEVGQIAAGMYREFDAVLKFREVLKESFAPSLEKVAAR